MTDLNKWYDEEAQILDVLGRNTEIKRERNVDDTVYVTFPVRAVLRLLGLTEDYQIFFKANPAPITENMYSADKELRWTFKRIVKETK